MSEQDINEQEEKEESTEVSTEAQPEAQPEENGGKNSLLCFYIAAVCFALGCVLFGISFAIKGAGVYLLISSMISELACVSFLNGQKKHGEIKACKIIRILSYIVMAAGIIVFVIGMSLSASAK
ncbi:MAG: hypothetical protein K2O44_04790 [Clostridia bacterium]|nr:hypothetical protein [Clostridia bacterium]